MKLGLRISGTAPCDHAGNRYDNTLPSQGTTVVSNRIRKMLGLSALAAFGAAEIAVVYGVVASIAELAFGVDLPLIWIVDSGDLPTETR
jgi:hypothetical protein